MTIKLTKVYVDDQEKALRFYTDVMGFVKKADFSQGSYRWLTVVSAEDQDGVELLLERNDNPAAKTFQQALYQQSQPASMFFTGDLQGDYERMQARGAEFTVPPKDVTASTICDGERHVRQPDSDHTIEALVNGLIQAAGKRSLNQNLESRC